MANESKVIGKTDDSAMALLFEMLGDKSKEIADIDSYYNIQGTYYFLEFIKCNIRPFDYDPNQNWDQISDQISIIWDFTCKANGILWLVCYEIIKEQFKLFKVLDMDDHQIQFTEVLEQDFATFKNWFQKFNSDVLKK